MENDNNGNDKITLGIAQQLAINGEYDEAIELLSPLVNSDYSIEANNLLAKIYAQRKDFSKAEEHFNNVLKLDDKNTEASRGLKKVRELKNSGIKTFFNYNKLKVYSILALLLILIGIIGVASLSMFSTTNSVYSEATILEDADLINMSIEASNKNLVISNIESLKSDKIKVVSNEDNTFNVSADKENIYDILYILDYLNKHYKSEVDIKNISFYLSDDVQNKAYADVNDKVISNSNVSVNNIKEMKNISQVIYPNTFSFDNITSYSAQQQFIYSMLKSDSCTKVKVYSVKEIIY